MAPKPMYLSRAGRLSERGAHERREKAPADGLLCWGLSIIGMRLCFVLKHRLHGARTSPSPPSSVSAPPLLPPPLHLRAPPRLLIRIISQCAPAPSSPPPTWCPLSAPGSVPIPPGHPHIRTSRVVLEAVYLGGDVALVILGSVGLASPWEALFRVLRVRKGSGGGVSRGRAAVWRAVRKVARIPKREREKVGVERLRGFVPRFPNSKTASTSIPDAEDTSTTYSKPQFMLVLPFIVRVRCDLFLRFVLVVAFWLALPSRARAQTRRKRQGFMVSHPRLSLFAHSCIIMGIIRVSLRLRPSMRISTS
ncbi:hypothetical protein C8R45DRAFT_1110662 [Mycena sanguinolenta]|nr:hypothetical protein C8R45DRAFT_1110662 [Mycena sanguinolenta]